MMSAMTTTAMTAVRQVAGAFLLALSAGCGASAATGGEDDTLDVDVASETDGLGASTSIDGELVTIEVRSELEKAGTAEGEPFDAEILVAVIEGASDAPYAEWRMNVSTDVLSGSLGGRSFTEAFAREVRAGRDWAELGASRVGTVLSEVSRRAAATQAAATFPEVEQQLVLLSEIGPFLQALPTMIGGVEAVCGDKACSVDENDENCPEDCGCAAATTCGGVAPFGCYCSDDCAENGDCCVDACQTCGAGCPPCGDRLPCDGSCTNVANACDGEMECPAGEDEARCSSGSCRAGQIACDDGRCLEFYQFCDGSSDCAGGEDELCECAYCDPG